MGQNKCNRYPECMPLLTSDRGRARTLDLPPQIRGRYRLSHGDYISKNINIMDKCWHCGKLEI
ncbi:hypothetical protein SK128_016577 [Halocaridina rubra]|uniref:Uncharacterized protein n=1 Tax=Halocaridina rubra TaxID=373956 RepID=A0AAN8WJ95_HALRR